MGKCEVLIIYLLFIYVKYMYSFTLFYILIHSYLLIRFFNFFFKYIMSKQNV